MLELWRPSTYLYTLDSAAFERQQHLPFPLPIKHGDTSGDNARLSGVMTMAAGRVSVVLNGRQSSSRHRSSTRPWQDKVWMLAERQAIGSFGNEASTKRLLSFMTRTCPPRQSLGRHDLRSSVVVERPTAVAFRGGSHPSSSSSSIGDP
jgi:hypothetical protein